MIGHAIQPVTAPLGFNWQIIVALIPGMAAREVAVGALGTIYAVDGGEGAAEKIGKVAGRPVAARHGAGVAGLVRVRAAMRLDARRHPPRDRQLEMGGVTFFYMLALAYAAALATNQIARALGAG